MSNNDLSEYLDEFDDDNLIHDLVQPGTRRPRKSTRHPKKLPAAVSEFVQKQDDSKSSFKYTYKAARFEAWWLLDSLGDFYEHKWITDVLSRVKGGKEASVYLCKTGDAIKAPLAAAKVYRPRMLRNLKNDAAYRLGRVDIDESGQAVTKDRDMRALQKRTDYGEEIRHQSWIAYELKTLELLHAAGADVPAPYAVGKNAILMEYIGDEYSSAPTLNSQSLSLKEAKILFERVVHNIDLMLTHERIHGDLSAFNILYWNGAITLIDFPQVVLARSNPEAWMMFQRDVTRVCQYFSLQGVKTDARKLAAELWISHGHKVVREVDPSHLDADKPEDRKIWEKQHKNI